MLAWQRSSFAIASRTDDFLIPTFIPLHLPDEPVGLHNKVTVFVQGSSVNVNTYVLAIEQFTMQESSPPAFFGFQRRNSLRRPAAH